MNWYKIVKSQITPHWDSAKRELPSIQEMINGIGHSKGLDHSELSKMIQEAEKYLKQGHDTEQVRLFMRKKLEAA